MTTAICLPDLLIIQRDHPVLALILQPHLGQGHFPIDQQHFDHEAIPLTCSDERADALLTIIRKRLPATQIRVWRRSGSRWKRI